MIHNWPYAARKRAGNAESSWRPPPDKNIELVPHCWGKKIARRNSMCTWDVKHIWHSDPADLIGRKTPDRAFWHGTRRYMPQVQIQVTSESVLFLPLSFFTLGKYNII